VNACKKCPAIISLLFVLLVSIVFAAEEPVAVFHAFDDHYTMIESYVCEISNQGYSHVQIPPAQKSNPDKSWWARYQPIDFSIIEGRGSETDLKKLIDKAHGCGVKVIADVVFNHMASLDEYKGLDKFPGLSKEDFHQRCDIDYSNRGSVMNCWLNGNLPDLNQAGKAVQTIQKNHIKKLLALGIDGFRFDAAKHMPADMVKNYIDYIDKESNGNTWNYLEVIEDSGTKAEDYSWVAAVTDFVLYKESLLKAFSVGGDLRSLKLPRAVDDRRSVTFGRNHDTILETNKNCIVGCYGDPTDSYLATTYVLAREQGTPLVLNWDNYDSPFIRYGAKFRRIMIQRGRNGENVKENILGVVDSPNVMIMERGSQGFFVLNKAADRFDIPSLDMTLTNLEGCYRELRRNFTVAVQKRDDGKKYVTRWGRWTRGGLEIFGREALYFVREPWEQCN
jgi:alpha-amylase